MVDKKQNNILEKLTYNNDLQMNLSLNKGYINETLSHYKDKNIYLEKAKLSMDEIEGEFNLCHYPFTKKYNIQYVTASMLILYLSQLGYVYIRALTENKNSNSNLDIDFKKFKKLRDSGKIIFHEFKRLKFKSFIPIEVQKLCITIKTKKVYKTKKVILAEIMFSTKYDEVFGEATIAVILDGKI